jgi:pyridoxal phosphate enzyme (YggS family)
VKDLSVALRERLQVVEERIGAACARSGRRREEVTLVAVTKTIPAKIAAVLPAIGLLDLAENRPQALWQKAAALPSGVRWHLVGHLQRNKIERTLPLVHLLHSADSMRLLAALETEAAKRGTTVPVLLEVNASREASKHGFSPEELPALVPELQRLSRVRILGLMTMAAYADDPEQCRPTFAEVRRLRDVLRERVAPPHQVEQLSMGMSNDFEVAVEEGATFVRLGTVLFEGLTE